MSATKHGHHYVDSEVEDFLWRTEVDYGILLRRMLAFTSKTTPRPRTQGNYDRFSSDPFVLPLSLELEMSKRTLQRYVSSLVHFVETQQQKDGLSRLLFGLDFSLVEAGEIVTMFVKAGYDVSLQKAVFDSSKPKEANSGCETESPAPKHSFVSSKETVVFSPSPSYNARVPSKIRIDQLAKAILLCTQTDIGTDSSWLNSPVPCSVSDLSESMSALLDTMPTYFQAMVASSEIGIHASTYGDQNITVNALWKTFRNLGDLFLHGEYHRARRLRQADEATDPAIVKQAPKCNETSSANARELTGASANDQHESEGAIDFANDDAEIRYPDPPNFLRFDFPYPPMDELFRGSKPQSKPSFDATSVRSELNGERTAITESEYSALNRSRDREDDRCLEAKADENTASQDRSEAESYDYDEAFRLLTNLIRLNLPPTILDQFYDLANVILRRTGGIEDDGPPALADEEPKEEEVEDLDLLVLRI